MTKHGAWCVIGAAALGLIAAEASAGQRFGSRLNRDPTPPEICRANNPGKLCSWVMTIAQAAPGRHRAPKNGIIARIRLISCTPGSFVLQIAQADAATEQAKVTRSGPLINYRGSRSNCDDEPAFVIETFSVRVPVRQGDVLSVAATRVGFILNASGDGTLVFDPPLADGRGLRTASDGTGSGILLLEAEYTD